MLNNLSILGRGSVSVPERIPDSVTNNNNYQFLLKEGVQRLIAGIDKLQELKNILGVAAQQGLDSQNLLNLGFQILSLYRSGPHQDLTNELIRSWVQGIRISEQDASQLFTQAANFLAANNINLVTLGITSLPVSVQPSVQAQMQTQLQQQTVLQNQPTAIQNEMLVPTRLMPQTQTSIANTEPQVINPKPLHVVPEDRINA